MMLDISGLQPELTGLVIVSSESFVENQEL